MGYTVSQSLLLNVPQCILTCCAYAGSSQRQAVFSRHWALVGATACLQDRRATEWNDIILKGIRCISLNMQAFSLCFVLFNWYSSLKIHGVILIYFRIAALTLGQSYECHDTNEGTLANTGEHWRMWVKTSYMKSHNRHDIPIYRQLYWLLINWFLLTTKHISHLYITALLQRKNLWITLTKGQLCDKLIHVKA